MKRERGVLLALVLVAFALRMHHLDVQSLWYDEGVTAQVARLGVGELTRWTANDIQPPLYYLIVAAWFRLLDPWAGNIAFVMRFVSVFAGTLLIPLLWALGRRLWGARGGLLSATVAALSPLMVYYSQEARMYAWLVMFTTLAALAIVNSLQSRAGANEKDDGTIGRRTMEANPIALSSIVHRLFSNQTWVSERSKWLVVYAAAGLAAMYTHYFAGFALLALSLYWLLMWLAGFQRKDAKTQRSEIRGQRSEIRDQRSEVRGQKSEALTPEALTPEALTPEALTPEALTPEALKFALANAVILLGYLPWLPAMWRRFQVDSSYWSGTLKLGEALLDVAMNFTTAATETMKESDARLWLPWLALAALIWLAALIRQMTDAKPNTQYPISNTQYPIPSIQYPAPNPQPNLPRLGNIALILLWLLLPVALILALAYRTPKFNPRYLMIAWPAWALLAGGGMAALWEMGGWVRGQRSEVRGLNSEALNSEVLKPEVLKPEALKPEVLRRHGWGRRGLAVLTGGLLLAAQLAGLQNWFGDLNFGKSAWRDAIAYMYENRQPDETVLLVSGHAYPVFDVYVPPELGVERARLPEMDILDVNQVVGWQDAATALNRLADKAGVWLFLWQDEVIDPTGVTALLLDRYAQPEPVPPFPFIGLRHYRFSADQHFAETPPITQPGRDFDDAIRLVGVEETDDGVWLYWQALRDDLPDLRVRIRITDAAGEVIFESVQRPAGYDFPTTHWQTGDIYPAWIPLAQGAKPWRVEVEMVEDGTRG